MKIKTQRFIVILACWLAAGVVAETETAIGFSQASESIHQRLADSLAELSRLREQIAAEKVPLSRELTRLESELVEVRRSYQQTTRLLDSRTLDLSNLQSEIKSRKDEAAYLSNLLGEYSRNFESRLHIAEIQRYQAPLETAKLAVENSSLSDQEIYAAQARLLSVAVDRLDDALGGTVFDGTASDASGSIHHGTFAVLGPAALFQSDDGAAIGTAEQRLGSLEPTVIAFGDPADSEAANAFFNKFKGTFPLDPTLGSAHKIEQTRETVVDEFHKGGLVMYPIVGLAAVSLLVAAFKMLCMFCVRTPSDKQIRGLLTAVAAHDETAALQTVRRIKGPVGRMLTAGVEHLREPRELIEEVMYEKVMAVRLKLERLLPFIAFSAASAPLLGLLGTVTGIINTFKLITVFGSGDVKSLSGGISEALITTKFGLIVAIPSLLFHTFLSRKARSIVNQMEKAAVALVNQISKTPYRTDSLETVGRPTAAQLQEWIAAMKPSPKADPAPAPTFEPDSAGRLMDRRVVRVTRTATVSDAIEQIRCSAIGDDVDAVFVVDDQGRYVGHVLVRHLLARPENAAIGALADTAPLYVRVDTHRRELAERFAEHDLISLPVLDHDDRLVGRLVRNGDQVPVGTDR